MDERAYDRRDSWMPFLMGSADAKPGMAQITSSRERKGCQDSRMRAREKAERGGQVARKGVVERFRDG